VTFWRQKSASSPGRLHSSAPWSGRSGHIARQIALARVKGDSYIPRPGASVAQLDRASDYGSEGSRFNSWRMRHFPNDLRFLKNFANRKVVSKVVTYVFGPSGL